MGMAMLSTFSELPSDALLIEAARLAAHERLATGQLIAALSEIDTRKLYLGEGCSSLFVYCTRVLHLSEHAAYSRIEAAPAVSKRDVEMQVAALRPRPAVAIHPEAARTAARATGRCHTTGQSTR